MSNKHTTGPWRIPERSEGRLLAVPECPNGSYPAFVAAAHDVCSGETIVAEVKMKAGVRGYGFPCVESHGEMEANARLIAAAPDLLAACERALALLDDVNGETDATAVWDVLSAALAKAKGEAAR